MGSIDHILMMKPAKDQGHIALRCSESSGNLGLAHRSAKLADFGNFLCSQKFLVHGDEPGIDGVLFVSPVIGPLKICDDVVSLGAINVVHNRKTIWVRNEGKSHQAVNKNRFGNVIGPETDRKVSKRMFAGPQDFSVTSTKLPGATRAHSVKASDAAQIADFVYVSKLSQVNGSPLFGECGNHAAGCPSGEVGLAIKNPSRARTHGGFVFVAPRRLQFKKMEA